MNQQLPLAAIIGANGSIGRAVVKNLAVTHRLALLDRDADGLSAVARGCPADACAFAVDAASRTEVDEAFAAIQRSGPLKALVIAVGTTAAGSLHEIGDAEWNEVISSNLTTVYQALRAGVTAMIGAGGGSICVIGSVHAGSPQPGFPAYAAAKAAVAALVMQAAAEYGHHGIRVNLITPGWTRTPHTTGRLDAGDEALLLDATPLRDLVEPQDIADAVAWMLSPQSRHVTGADLVVDAGSRLLGAATGLRPAYRSRLGLTADVHAPSP